MIIMRVLDTVKNGMLIKSLCMYGAKNQWNCIEVEVTSQDISDIRLNKDQTKELIEYLVDQVRIRDEEEDDTVSKSIRDLPITDLRLSVRVDNALAAGGIYTVGDLIFKSEYQWNGMRGIERLVLMMANLGRKSLIEIKEELGKIGIK